MNFGYRPPKKEVDRGRPPEMVLISEDDASRSPNTSLLIEKKMQGTPDTTKLIDDMVGGDNWEFQMDPFDTWNHEKENQRAPHRVDPHMPRRSFIDKALCRKPKMKEGIASKNHPSMPPNNVSERLLCKKPKSNRSKSVPRNHRPKHSRRKPEALFQDMGTPSPKKKTPSKYNQQVDEFVEVMATPKQLNRVADLSDIEQREKEKREQEKYKAVSPTNNTYSQPLRAPTLDDGNSVVVDGNASVQHETIIVPVSPEDTRSVVQQKSDEVLASIRCAPLCNAGEMLFMAVDPVGPPKQLTNEKAPSPAKPHSNAPNFERIHHSMPVSNSAYLEQSLANSFQGRSDEADSIKKKRVQSYSPNKQNRYSREAFEEEIRIYQKHLRESRNRSKMEDIQERGEYGESASTGGFKSRRAMHQSNKQIESSNPHRRSRSVGRSEASSSSSSSSSQSQEEYIPGRSARWAQKGRSKSAHRSSPSKRDDKANHPSHEAPTTDLPRKRSDFMISGMEMVTGDIERHRSQPKKEHHHRSHQARPKPESRRTRMKPEWMLTPNLSKPERADEKRGATNDVFHNESGPVPIGDVISVPSSSNKLPIKTVEIPVMVDSFQGSEKEDLRILEDDTDLDSAAFNEFDSESIYKDLKKTEKRRRSLRSTKSYDASGKYSRHSRKSGGTRHTDFTYGSASVEFDGCF